VLGASGRVSGVDPAVLSCDSWAAGWGEAAAVSAVGWCEDVEEQAETIDIMNITGITRVAA